jgi:two-component system, chemotaxis family, chemotaxis protein CheY
MTVRALVVDDSMPLRRSVMYALQRLGDVVCVEATDGADGLKKFERGEFHIILTDINMPILDGLKLVSHIRSSSKNATVPIVVITTESAEEDRQRALHLGANAYLLKPVQAQQVLDTVRSLLPSTVL